MYSAETLADLGAVEPPVARRLHVELRALCTRGSRAHRAHEEAELCVTKNAAQCAKIVNSPSSDTKLDAIENVGHDAEALCKPVVDRGIPGACVRSERGGARGR